MNAVGIERFFTVLRDAGVALVDRRKNFTAVMSWLLPLSLISTRDAGFDGQPGWKSGSAA